MNKIFFCIIATSIFLTNNIPSYSTTSVATLIGAKILAQSKTDISVKYKRKDCPVCKGKGWYMSGDDIKKIECGYCEPDTTQATERPKHKTIISKG